MDCILPNFGIFFAGDRDKVYGGERPEHPEVARSLNILAALYQSQGRYAEARPHYKQALTYNATIVGDSEEPAGKSRLKPSRGERDER